MRKISLLALALLCQFGMPVWADQWAAPCEAKSTSSIGDCDKELASVANNAQNMSSAIGSKIKNSATDTAINSQNVQGGTQAQADATHMADLATAKTQCEADKKQCDQTCDKQKSAAQAVPPTPQSTKMRAQADIPKIDDAKTKCDTKIDQDIAALDKDSSNSAKNKDGSEDTGKGAGMAPPSAPPAGGNDAKPQSTTPDPTSTTCITDPSSCATTPAPVAAADPLAVTPQSIADALGQSGYTAPAGKVDPAAAAAAALTNGPIPANPYGTAYGGGASAGGGVPGGGGGGGSMGSSAGATLTPQSADGKPAGSGLTASIGSMSTEGGGGGGGGGGGYSNNSSDSGSGDGGRLSPEALLKWAKEKPLLPAAPAAGSPYTDQSQPHGPSLFFIADKTHEGFCKKHHFSRACVHSQ